MEGMNGVKVRTVAQIPYDMNGKELADLERVVRNLPCRRMKFGFVETDFGRVYLAWGRAADETWHGVWGLRGVARLCEFGPALTEEGVRQNMVDNAAEYSAMAGERGLWDEGFWRGGRA